VELFIKLRSEDTLPSIKELIDVMWYENVSVSRVGNDELLRRGEEISLAWDKWIDDQRWSNHSKSKEYIYFQLIQPNLLKIEIDDSATYVDKRAVIFAGRMLMEIDDTDSSFDKETWLSKIEFVEKSNHFLESTFENAVKKSLIE
jgi:hypothetical protein